MNDDLISRVALLERFEGLKNNPNNSFRDMLFLNGVMSVIDNAPAVDAKTVRRGKWENIKRPGSSLWCSECKAPSPWTAYHNFCPNCGAEMDLE